MEKQTAGFDILHPADEAWWHTTSRNMQSRENQAGIDLYDDEQPGFISIYVRYKDGTRSPARTVGTDDPEATLKILRVWAKTTGDGIVNDYRSDKSLVL